ncbi:MAG: MBL fold metallo-hydrolase [Burkholderiales bacterium]|nr:MBL fold metallo-hydrolase [Burkholderiales bacterium]MDE1926811.1 MBL fold metallo-hydrolase [Burkholderiales bacterium]MDE2158858.1 MBL fold metallo-hydrolase [Burkholderiales bacterium]MDE2504308.1 MBL fold metallo-hydrolase [Burkholderiales bacterium]
MANADEAALHYPRGDELPAAGTAIEVAPGLRWLRMKLPFALDHINLWLLRDRDEGIDGWTIVDCGIADDPTRANWEHLFEHELQGLPVLRVVVTHMHPDHIGLAHWLTERWSRPGRDCRLWISATDWNAARLASRSTLGFGGEAAARFFARHGLNDPLQAERVRARGSYYGSLVPQVPASFRRLMDGMTLTIGGRSWRCLVGYGHAPEHMALHCAELGVLISGDMVLPRISTNVSVIDIEPEADPLPLYLASIAALRALPATTLVLPSHGKPFTGLHTRIAQLHAHHEARYAEVLEACAEAPRSAADLLPLLFRRQLDLHQTTFAMGEAIAHVHALAGMGRLRSEAGADGVLRFRATN